MTDHEQYTLGPASGARVVKGRGKDDRVSQDEEKWTLILVRELRHSPEKVWQALTDPAQLREWAPFVTDGSLGTVGATVKLTWVGAAAPIETKVTRADSPTVLEYGDIRWELKAFGKGTRLTLWHNIDRRFIAWGAAGWHIAFDVLDRLLKGNPIGRIVDANAMKRHDWKRLVEEYAKQFGTETPKRSDPTTGRL
ncbi:MAG: SRPBCC family protein [Acidobacteriales bacterium]|nr:SRPBCC family protein [Terriglobales bacterium]